jgi:SWI/SNF-related matrix-associated actin-dependent regulator 1 of chromatin subfamily A
MPVKALPYQKDGVRDIEDQDGRALLADEMGLGKTPQVLWFLKRQRVPTFPALIVCPAAVKHLTWEHMALDEIGIRAQVFEGKTPPRGTVDRRVPPISIINPDILPRWVEYIRKLNLTTVVLDECQMFGNPTSTWTRAAFDITRDVRNVIGLSGTALLNRPAELWPTLHMIWPDKFPSFFSYGQEYCKPRREYGKMSYKGAENLPQLHRELRRAGMIRRLKADVMSQLPAKMRTVVPMEIANEAEYRHATVDFIGWLRKNYGKVKAKRSARAAAVTRIGYLLRLAARLKARAVVQWANTFLEDNPTEKLVIFAVHQKMVEVLHRRVAGGSVVINGGVSSRRRKLAVEQFQRDPNIRTIIGNVRAMGVGINGLQNVCSNAAFAELPWRPGDLLQAEDRLYRIGQDYVSWMWYLVAGNTIEVDVCRILQKKQEVIRAVLDGREMDDDLDIFDQLIEVLGAAT